jgi:hypothetical protein
LVWVIPSGQESVADADDLDWRLADRANDVDRVGDQVEEHFAGNVLWRGCSGASRAATSTRSSLERKA